MVQSELEKIFYQHKKMLEKMHTGPLYWFLFLGTSAEPRPFTIFLCATLPA